LLVRLKLPVEQGIAHAVEDLDERREQLFVAASELNLASDDPVTSANEEVRERARIAAPVEGEQGRALVRRETGEMLVALEIVNVERVLLDVCSNVGGVSD
jgi:hypothetical protein